MDRQIGRPIDGQMDRNIYIQMYRQIVIRQADRH